MPNLNAEKTALAETATDAGVVHALKAGVR